MTDINFRRSRKGDLEQINRFVERMNEELGKDEDPFDSGEVDGKD